MVVDLWEGTTRSSRSLCHRLFAGPSLSHSKKRSAANNANEFDPASASTTPQSIAVGPCPEFCDVIAKTCEYALALVPRLLQTFQLDVIRVL